MKITQDNYYSKAANVAYFTASQIKSWMKCPSMWQAERMGIYERPETDALFHGQYVDTALTEPENFDQFCIDNADKIYGRGKKKYKAIIDIDHAIARVKRDDYFMHMLEGSAQEIIVLENFHGHPYKCRMDVLSFDHCRVVDLKTCKGIEDEEWTRLDDGTYAKMHWIAHWKYPLQMALYRDAIFQEHMFRPHPYILGMEKKEVPNFDVFDLMDKRPLQGELQRGIDAMDQMAVDRDKDALELRKCKRCKWCLMNKKLIDAVKFKFDPRMLQF
jgi:hypothetical protein